MLDPTQPSLLSYFDPTQPAAVRIKTGSVTKRYGAYHLIYLQYHKDRKM